MGAQVKRRDVGALVLLIGLELALLCLLGVMFRFDGGDRDLASRGPRRVEALTAHWPALGPEPLTCEPEAPEPPPEPPKPVEPVRRAETKPAPTVEVAREVAPAAPVVARPPVPEPLPAIVERGAPDVADPCGGDLCCVAAAAPAALDADAAWADAGPHESDVPGRMVIRWPASARDDVVYRVFTIPGRRFVGSSGENWLVHLRRPSDPDCYKIQACDRAGIAAGGPVTICIQRRRTWG
jgi:hypothetical protein